MGGGRSVLDCAGRRCNLVCVRDAMSKNELVDVGVDFKHETEKAYLVNDGKKDVWLPKSMVEAYKDSGVVVLPVWLARDKELI